MTSPVLWARGGPLTSWLASRWPAAQPPILLLSYPRSGSSWLGETLGHASNAMYLREPINLSYQAQGGRGSVFTVDTAQPPPAYRRAAQHAFTAIPTFDPGVVRWPAQWRLAQRAQRRVVIKEVNPAACAWFIAAFRPRIVFLMRHPAAVALSYRRMGWQQFPTLEQWRKHGLRQGSTLHTALTALSAYPDHRLVRYEDVCRDPLATFQTLFDFCSLTWDAQSVQFIQTHTTHSDDAPGGTARRSQLMPDAWRSHIGPNELAALHDGFAAAQLPHYADAGDWSLA